MATPDKKPTDTSTDDLLSKLKASRANDVAGKARKTLKDAEALGRNINDIAEGVKKTSQTLGWLRKNIAAPVWSILNPVFGRGFRAYGRLWNRTVNVKDADGDMIFSKKRAGLMVLATVFAAAAAVEVAPEIGRSAFYASWWAVSNKSEILIMQKADPSKGSSYVASACHSWPCSDTNTIDFQIDDSAFHDIHRLATHGELFIPSVIANAVPAIPSACDIEYYGSRGKIFARWGHFYPRLFEVKECLPIPAGFPDGPVTRESFEKLKRGDAFVKDASKVSQNFNGTTTAPVEKKEKSFWSSTVAPALHIKP